MKVNKTEKVTTNWHSKGVVFANCSKCGVLRIVSKELMTPDLERYKDIGLPDSSLCYGCKNNHDI